MFTLDLLAEQNASVADTLAGAVSALPARERFVVKHSFGLQGAPTLSAEEIALELRDSVKNVHCILAEGLRSLRSRTVAVM